MEIKLVKVIYMDRKYRLCRNFIWKQVRTESEFRAFVGKINIICIDIYMEMKVSLLRLSIWIGNDAFVELLYGNKIK